MCMTRSPHAVCLSATIEMRGRPISRPCLAPWPRICACFVHDHKGLPRLRDPIEPLCVRSRARPARPLVVCPDSGAGHSGRLEISGSRSISSSPMATPTSHCTPDDTSATADDVAGGNGCGRPVAHCACDVPAQGPNGPAQHSQQHVPVITTVTGRGNAPIVPRIKAVKGAQRSQTADAWLRYFACKRQQG